MRNGDKGTGGQGDKGDKGTRGQGRQGRQISISPCLLVSVLRALKHLAYHVWLKRESLLRDNRSHAPVEARNKCLDLSRIYIAGKYLLYYPERHHLNL
jgi:hypothetical protein